MTLTASSALRIPIAVLFFALGLLGTDRVRAAADVGPDLAPYARYFIDDEPGPGRQVTATFLGVASILISDGETAVMTDGFFTRPDLRALGRGAEIMPDRTVIALGLERAGVERLAAVMAVHSHFDHAMDSPEVAQQTGAVLLGSESTANIGRGWGLPEDRIVVVEPGKPLRFGDFTITFVVSKHIKLNPDYPEIPETIDEPLTPPVPVSAYKEGGSYSILVSHPLGTVLIQGSAGFVEGALAGRKADLVFLGVGFLGAQSDQYREAYLRETAGAVGATRIVPIHYDVLTLPSDRPLVPSPDFGQSMAFLDHWIAGHPGTSLALLPPFEPVVLFRGE